MTSPIAPSTPQPHTGTAPPSPDATRNGVRTEPAAHGPIDDAYREWLGVARETFPTITRAAVFTWEARAAAPGLVAAWPEDGGNVESLAAAAAQAATRKRGLGVLPPSGAGTGWRLAHPITVAGEIRGAVALELGEAPGGGLPAALGRLQSSTSRLEAAFARESGSVPQPVPAKLRSVVELVASALGSDRFQPCAQTFAATLANRLRCDRVSIGFVEGGQVRVRAMSHTADFRGRTGVVRAVAAAMEESLDQKAAVVVPATGDLAQVSIAHESLARKGPSAVCTVPFAHGSQLVGAITLERAADQPFDAATVDLVDAVGALAGPSLNALRREDRWLGAKAADSLRHLTGNLIGVRHTGLKLAALSMIAGAVLLAMAEGEYRLSARAAVEPQVRRAAVAPIRGYLREASVRAGDRVTRGQLLAALDDRELTLERARWESQRVQVVRQRAAALAQLNASQLGIASAQIDQAAAQIALIDDQLGKMRIQADFDGMVVSGDLSQSLGSPIEKGQVLFEIAPLDSYRLVLHVDERDVGGLTPGQRGELVLAAAPGETLAFVVKQVTPVSMAHEGRNYFKVEAATDTTPAWLRPGLEGVAKLETGRGRLLGVWLRPAVDWLRLAAWTWMP